MVTAATAGLDQHRAARGRHRLSAIHLGLHLRSQGRRCQPRQSARQPGNDPHLARQHEQSTYVNWVPLYHDMGLILNALQALYVGPLCVLMAPNAFTQRPLSWLRAISDYRAEVGCRPEFRL